MLLTDNSRQSTDNSRQSTDNRQRSTVKGRRSKVEGLDMPDILDCVAIPGFFRSDDRQDARAVRPYYSPTNNTNIHKYN